MVIRLFSGNRAGVLLLLPVFMAVYLFMNSSTGYYIQDTTINFGLWGESVILNPLISTSLAVVVVFFNSFAINWIFNTNEFLERNNYMPSLLYMTLMSFYHSFYSIDGLLLSHTCLIGMLYFFFKLRQNEDSRANVFNGAFFAGLAATFHPPLIGFLPIIFVMVWGVRPFVAREFILIILGFGIPLLYAGVFIFFSDHTIQLRLLEQATNYYKKQVDFLITSILFTLLFILSVIAIRGRMLKSSTRLRKMVNMLWWLVGAGVILGIIDYIFFEQIERFSILMIPLSFFLTFSFSNKTVGLTATTLFYLTFAYSFVNFFI